jgi:sulfite oxidase
MFAQVLDQLETMRIGILPETERIKQVDDPYANDPPRDKRIVVQSQTPFNGETPAYALNGFITPTELHFKRSHMPIPQILPEAYSLQVCTM